MRQEPIYFYRSGDPYDIFSNVVPTSFRFMLNGGNISASCSEAVFQGIKGITCSGHEELGWHLLHGTPGAHLQAEARLIQNSKYFQPYDPSQRPYPYEVRHQVMYEILLCKFTQSPLLLKALLETGEQPIIENTSLASYDDSEWGNGHANNGKNMLGNILMRIRFELRQEISVRNGVFERRGFGAGLCNFFGFTYTEHHQFIAGANMHQIPLIFTVAEYSKFSLPETLPQPQQLSSVWQGPQQQAEQDPSQLLRVTIGDADIQRVMYKVHASEKGSGQVIRDECLRAMTSALRGFGADVREYLSVRFAVKFDDNGNPTSVRDGIYLIFLLKSYNRLGLFANKELSNAVHKTTEVYNILLQHYGSDHFDLVDTSHVSYGANLKSHNIGGIIKVSKEMTAILHQAHTSASSSIAPTLRS